MCRLTSSTQSWKEQLNPGEFLDDEQQHVADRIADVGQPLGRISARRASADVAKMNAAPILMAKTVTSV